MNYKSHASHNSIPLLNLVGMSFRMFACALEAHLPIRTVGKFSTRRDASLKSAHNPRNAVFALVV